MNPINSSKFAFGNATKGLEGFIGRRSVSLSDNRPHGQAGLLVAGNPWLAIPDSKKTPGAGRYAENHGSQVLPRE